jgi:hypothetical protein
MKKLKSLMNRKSVKYCLSTLLFGGACLAPWLAVSPAFAAPTQNTDKRTEITSIKGTCNFGGKNSTWSAKLKANGDGTYNAVYVSSWGNKPLHYVGKIKTDMNEISGNGKASGGSANGNFEFSGKFGKDGIAQCTYKEIGGRRSGTMTAELPK